MKNTGTAISKLLIPFSRARRKKHPHDDKILILMAEPFSKNKEFYEFTVDSIGQIEEIGTITNQDGESALQIRVWVKKGTPAIKSKPFIVS